MAKVTFPLLIYTLMAWTMKITFLNPFVGHRPPLAIYLFLPYPF
jgi:hypothetical protein